MADLQIIRPVTTTLDQERREVLETVMGALSSRIPDADEIAACRYLLQHLARIPDGCAA